MGTNVARTGLLQFYATRSRAGHNPARNPGPADAARACVRVHAALDGVEFHAARTGVRPHFVGHTRDTDRSGPGLRVHGAVNAIHRHGARAGVSPQPGIRGNRHLVSDGDAAAQFRVLHLADANHVSILLDGRMRLDGAHTFLGAPRTEDAFAPTNGAAHHDRRCAAGAYLDIPGAGLDVEIDGTFNIERAVERALCVGAERHTAGDHCDRC